MICSNYQHFKPPLSYEMCINIDSNKILNLYGYYLEQSCKGICTQYKPLLFFCFYKIEIKIMITKKSALLTLLLVLFYSALYAQVNTESFRTSDKKTGFSLISDVDLTLMAGNTDFQYFGTNTKVNFNRSNNYYTFLILNGGFGRNEGKTFFSQALVHFRNVDGLSDNLQLEEFIQYDNNKSLLLLNRYLAGTGLRFKIYRGEKIAFRVGSNIFYEWEKYDLPVQSKHGRETKVIRLNTYITCKINIKEDLTFLSVSYLQPDIGNIKDLRVLSNNALQVKLSENLSLQVKLDARYDSRSADGIKSFDLFSKLGLSVKID